MKIFGTLIAFFLCLHQHCGNSAELEENAAQHNEGPMVRATRGGLNMLRLGRSMNFRTRGVRMLRLGKRSEYNSPLNRLTYDDLKDILYSLYDEEKHPMARQPPLPRYGRELDWQDDSSAADGALDKKLSPGLAMQLLAADAYSSHMRPAPRLGRFRRSLPDAPPSADIDEESVETNDENKERAVPMPRFGRLTDELESARDQDDSDEEKERGEKAVPMPRIGRENEDYILDNEFYPENEKRALAMLRLGRSMNMLRLGKRPGGYDDATEKRSLALLRLGKRRMRILRLGKRESENGDEADKRSLKLLRLGKRTDGHDIDTRAISMLRLGRSQDINDKRSLKLLRLG